MHQHGDMTGDDEAPVFPTAPPERIELGGDVALVRCDPDRAADAARSINESLEHLRPWMAWAAEPATEAGIATFFAAGEELWQQRKSFEYSLVEGPDERVIGGFGLHGRLGRNGLEIGYWVHADRAGRGLATAAARALTDAAFSIEGIERVRIQLEDGNAASARVPEKLGYRFEGVIVPDDGPCDGRPTQIWLIDLEAWVAAGGQVAP